MPVLIRWSHADRTYAAAVGETEYVTKCLSFLKDPVFVNVIACGGRSNFSSSDEQMQFFLKSHKIIAFLLDLLDACVPLEFPLPFVHYSDERVPEECFLSHHASSFFSVLRSAYEKLRTAAAQSDQCPPTTPSKLVSSLSTLPIHIPLPHSLVRSGNDIVQLFTDSTQYCIIGSPLHSVSLLQLASSFIPSFSSVSKGSS